MSKRTVSAVSVEDVEKRRHPSKHYVYVIYVTWSNGTEEVVFRRYSKFFDLQVRLLDKFPIDGGHFDPAKRCIPFLPGKILLGRSHIREVAMKRLQPIDDYCKKLIKLEPHISESLDVLDFFESKPDDYMSLEARRGSVNSSNSSNTAKNDGELKNISNPRSLEQYMVVEDYKKVGANEVSLARGDVVEVVEKNKTGWWFISTEDSQGWAPSSHLMPKDGQRDSLVYQQSREGQGDKFIVHKGYVSQEEDELSVDKGKIVEVLEQTLDGWWLIKYNNKRGRFPSTNLHKADTLRAHGLAGRKPAIVGAQVVPNIRDVTGPATRRAGGSSDASSEDNHLRPDWENVIKKASPLPEAKKRPAPRSTPKKPARPPLPSPSKMPQMYVTVEDFDSSTVGDGISFRKGQVAKVLEKTDQGWWFVNIEGTEGWAPSAYLELKKMGSSAPLPVPPTKARPKLAEPIWPSESPYDNAAVVRNPAAASSANSDRLVAGRPEPETDTSSGNDKYIALHDYTGEDSGELSFREGQIVTLIAEHDLGWWQVKLESGQEGYAPSTYFDSAPSTRNGHEKPASDYSNERSYVSQNKNKFDKPSFTVNKPSAAVKPTVMSKPALRAKPGVNSNNVPVLPKKPLQPSNKQGPATNKVPQKSSKISQMTKMFE